MAHRGSRSSLALLVVVLALLSILPPLSTDMYLPVMDLVGDSLNAGGAAMGLSLSLFFLGLCVGQFGMGPLIDGYGRKAPVIIGTLLFTVTAAGLLLVGRVEIFNGLRLFQAMGACAGMVVGRAVVADLFDGREAAQKLTILALLSTIGPIISPFLGSVLMFAFGWKSIFVTMVLAGVVALLSVIFFLPETLPREKRGKTPFRDAFRGYATLLRRPDFLLASIVSALVQSAMFAFITASSGVFKGAFKLGNLSYGLLFGLVAAALVVFSHANTRLLDRYSPIKLMNVFLPVFAGIGVLLLIVAPTSHLWVFVVPLWCAIGLVGLLGANSMAVTMETARANAGVGSSLLGGIQFGAAFVVSSAVAVIETGDGMPLALGIVVPALLACALWFGPALFGKGFRDEVPASR